MATGYRTCKICGERYEYCMTNRSNTIFRWQDVACCPEHGAEYFRKIAESRGEVKTVCVVNELQTDDDFDVLFDEDFDDGEEELEIEL